MLILAPSEPTFYTLQGEGKYIGYPSVFIRLSRCNLRCMWQNANGTFTKCDTPHTSFEPEIDEVKISKLVETICNYDTEHIVISGGEPFFQKKVTILIHELVKYGKFVTVETNGTIYHENEAQFISLSPKLSTSSGHPTYGKMHDLHRINYSALSNFITKSKDFQFKFVVNTEDDIKEILEIKRVLFERTTIDINDYIWLMPQGIAEYQFDGRLKWLAEICKQYKWKLTDRFHIRLFGSGVGV